MSKSAKNATNGSSVGMHHDESHRKENDIIHFPRCNFRNYLPEEVRLLIQVQGQAEWGRFFNHRIKNNEKQSEKLNLNEYLFLYYFKEYLLKYI